MPLFFAETAIFRVFQIIAADTFTKVKDYLCNKTKAKKY